MSALQARRWWHLPRLWSHRTLRSMLSGTPTQSLSIFYGRLGRLGASDLRLVEPDDTTDDFFNTPEKMYHAGGSAAVFGRLKTVPPATFH